MRARRMTWRMAVHVLCMVALVAIGFAHKVPEAVAAPQTSVDFSAYTLPDGSLPVLCISEQSTFTFDDHGKQHDHAGQSGCDACRISASILLPAPADTGGVRAEASLDIAGPSAEAPIILRLFPPNTAPRAPPLA